MDINTRPVGQISDRALLFRCLISQDICFPFSYWVFTSLKWIQIEYSSFSQALTLFLPASVVSFSLAGSSKVPNGQWLPSLFSCSLLSFFKTAILNYSTDSLQNSMPVRWMVEGLLFSFTWWHVSLTFYSPCSLAFLLSHLKYHASP